MTCSWHAGSGMCSGACCWRYPNCVLRKSLALYTNVVQWAQDHFARRPHKWRSAVSTRRSSAATCPAEWNFIISLPQGVIFPTWCSEWPPVWRRVNRHVEASSLEHPSRSTGPGFAQRSSLIRLEGCPSLSGRAASRLGVALVRRRQGPLPTPSSSHLVVCTPAYPSQPRPLISSYDLTIALIDSREGGSV